MVCLGAAAEGKGHILNHTGSWTRPTVGSDMTRRQWAGRNLTQTNTLWTHCVNHHEEQIPRMEPQLEPHTCSASCHQKLSADEATSCIQAPSKCPQTRPPLCRRDVGSTGIWTLCASKHVLRKWKVNGTCYLSGSRLLFLPPPLPPFLSPIWLN